MTADAAAVDRERSWLCDVADAFRLGPIAFGVGVFASMALIFLIWEIAHDRVGQVGLGEESDAIIYGGWVALVHIACTAYLMAASVASVRMGEQTLGRVKPLLRSGAKLDATLRPSGERAALLVAGVAGAGGWLGATLMSPGPASFDPRHWSAEVAWHRILGATFGILAFRLSARLVLQSLRLSRLAAWIADIDLLDPSSLAPFTRQGLANALLTLGFAAVFSLFLVDLRYLGIALPLWAFTGGVAAAGLLLPLLGVRRRIQQAKRAELAWCRERLREARRALGAGQGLPTRLDELVAWECRIEDVREWPLDTTALTRFALYLLLPLGSWTAAALIERAVDLALE
jgi:hypothetical protein